MFMATFIVCVNFLKAWLLSELLLVCLFREVEKGELNRWECTETQIKQANTTTTYTFGKSWDFQIFVTFIICYWYVVRKDMRKKHIVLLFFEI